MTLLPFDALFSFPRFTGSIMVDPSALVMSNVQTALGDRGLLRLDFNYRDLLPNPLQQYSMTLCIGLGVSVAPSRSVKFADKVIPPLDRFE